MGDPNQSVNVADSDDDEPLTVSCAPKAIGKSHKGKPGARARRAKGKSHRGKPGARVIKAIGKSQKGKSGARETKAKGKSYKPKAGAKATRAKGNSHTGEPRARTARPGSNKWAKGKSHKAKPDGPGRGWRKTDKAFKTPKRGCRNADELKTQVKGRRFGQESLRSSPRHLEFLEHLERFDRLLQSRSA
jgi:hypothetical protein